MKKPNVDMHLPKGCKIIIEINDSMRLGYAKLLADQIRSQFRKVAISDFHISIETESPDYVGPEKVFSSSL